MSPLWSLQRLKDRAWYCVVYRWLSHHRGGGTYLQEATQQVLDYIHPMIRTAVDFFGRLLSFLRLSYDYLLELYTSERTLVISSHSIEASI